MTTSIRLRRALAVLAIAATFGLAGCSLLGFPTGATPTPTPTIGQSTDVFTIKVGDCVNDGKAPGEVSRVHTVPCSTQHDSEAYSSANLADGTFPGAQAVTDQAISGCTASFTAFVGLEYKNSKLAFSYYYPTQASWSNGDRQILCLIFDPVGKTTGSLKGAAR